MNSLILPHVIFAMKSSGQSRYVNIHASTIRNIRVAVLTIIVRAHWVVQITDIYLVYPVRFVKSHIRDNSSLVDKLYQFFLARLLSALFFIKHLIYIRQFIKKYRFVIEFINSCFESEFRFAFQPAVVTFYKNLFFGYI